MGQGARRLQDAIISRGSGVSKQVHGADIALFDSVSACDRNYGGILIVGKRRGGTLDLRGQEKVETDEQVMLDPPQVSGASSWLLTKDQSYLHAAWTRNVFREACAPASGAAEVQNVNGVGGGSAPSKNAKRNAKDPADTTMSNITSLGPPSALEAF